MSLRDTQKRLPIQLRQLDLVQRRITLDRNPTAPLLNAPILDILVAVLDKVADKRAVIAVERCNAFLAHIGCLGLARQSSDVPFLVLWSDIVVSPRRQHWFRKALALVSILGSKTNPVHGLECVA
jgi:hypothetical protein